MDTDQIFDLFNLDGDDKTKSEKLKTKLSSKEAIEGLDKLWDEEEYEDLAVDEFLNNLKKK
jgi:hypothetical protein